MAIKFEVVNDKGKTVFVTIEEFCLPPKSEINALSKTGHKFKWNGKIISKKKLEEFIFNNKGEKNIEKDSAI